MYHKSYTNLSSLTQTLSQLSSSVQCGPYYTWVTQIVDKFISTHPLSDDPEKEPQTVERCTMVASPEDLSCLQKLLIGSAVKPTDNKSPQYIATKTSQNVTTVMTSGVHYEVTRFDDQPNKIVVRIVPPKTKFSTSNTKNSSERENNMPVTSTCEVEKKIETLNIQTSDRDTSQTPVSHHGPTAAVSATQNLHVSNADDKKYALSKSLVLHDTQNITIACRPKVSTASDVQSGIPIFPMPDSMSNADAQSGGCVHITPKVALEGSTNCISHEAVPPEKGQELSAHAENVTMLDVVTRTVDKDMTFPHEQETIAQSSDVHIAAECESVVAEKIFHEKTRMCTAATCDVQAAIKDAVQITKHAEVSSDVTNTNPVAHVNSQDSDEALDEATKRITDLLEGSDEDLDVSLDDVLKFGPGEDVVDSVLSNMTNNTVSELNQDDFMDRNRDLFNQCLDTPMLNAYHEPLTTGDVISMAKVDSLVDKQNATDQIQSPVCVSDAADVQSNDSDSDVSGHVSDNSELPTPPLIVLDDSPVMSEATTPPARSPTSMPHPPSPIFTPSPSAQIKPQMSMTSTIKMKVLSHSPSNGDNSDNEDCLENPEISYHVLVHLQNCHQ